MTAIPKPRRRLWRTWLKWPRDLRQFAPRIDARDLLAAPPDEEELAHWGEIILLEDIVIALHRDGTTSWLTHLVTMPYSNELLSKWDDVNRTYDERTTRLSLRRAVVYSPSAGLRKAAKQVAPLSPYERLQKLTFAPLHPGVTIEMEMQDDSFVAETPGPSIWANFALITAPPCRRRRLTAAIAEPFTATVRQHFGGESPRATQQGDYRVYQWELFDVPGIEFDAFTPPPHDFIPWIDVSSLPDWEPIARHYRRELLPPRPTPGPVAQLARELTAAATTPRQRLEAIYAYAARDVRYGRHPSELSTPKIRDAAKMLEDLRGDCKDKSSLMVAMLHEVGIPAEVVVVLTGQNGRTPFLPSRRFDHAIVRATIGDRHYWLDPAAGPFGFDELPEGDQGVPALLLDYDRHEMMTTPRDSPERQLTSRQCRGELTGEGDYQFRAEVTTTGEKAAQYRMFLQDRTPEHRRKALQQSVAEERPGAVVDEIEIGSVDDLAEPMRLAYRVLLKRWGRPIQDLMLFRVPWGESCTMTGPMTAAERQLPTQLPVISDVRERHEIKLPSRFSGYGLPYVDERSCEGCSYRLEVTCVDGMLVCDRRMVLHGGIIPPDRFSSFKQFWEDCTRSDQIDIVLMRRS